MKVKKANGVPNSRNVSKEVFAFNQEVIQRMMPERRYAILHSLNQPVQEAHLEQIISGVLPRLRTFIVLRDHLYSADEVEGRRHFFQLYKKARYKQSSLSDEDQTMLLKLVLERAKVRQLQSIANLHFGLSFKELIAFEAGKDMLDYPKFKSYLQGCNLLKTKAEEYLTWYSGLLNSSDPVSSDPEVFSPLYVEGEPTGEPTETVSTPDKPLEVVMSPFHIDQFPGPTMRRSQLAVRGDMKGYQTLMRKIRDILGINVWNSGYSIASMRVFMTGHIVTPMDASLHIVARLKGHTELQREYLTFLAQGFSREEMVALIDAANTGTFKGMGASVESQSDPIPKRSYAKKLKKYSNIDRNSVWNGNPPQSAEEIGKMIQDFRILSGKTQREVAKEVGVTSNCVYGWETGKAPALRFRTRLIKSILPGVTKQGIMETMADFAIMDR